MLNNSNSLDLEISTAGNNEKGFTVVEVIIAMVTFLIVTGAVYGVLVIAQRSRTTVNQQVQLTKSVRLALNLVGRDTYNAGFGYPLKNVVKLQDNKIATLIGVPVDTGNVDDVVPPVIAGNDITTNTFAVPNTTTDQITFLFKDSTFNLLPAADPPDKQISQPMDITISSSGGIDQATVVGSNAACSVNDIYVVTGNSGAATLAVATDTSVAGVVKFANTDLLSFNQSGNPTILTALGTKGTMQRVRLITYFVAADGTLTRREFANTLGQKFVDEPLVYGVEDFQIQYILADGTLSDNPSAGADLNAGTGDDDQSKLATIRQIRFTVNARAIDTDAAGQPYRVTMTAVFGTRNLGYNPN